MAQDDPLNDPSARQMTASMTMMGKESEEYFQTVVISALLNILNDSALTPQFLGVIEVIMKIFKTQGLRCAAFLPQVCDHTERGVEANGYDRLFQRSSMWCVYRTRGIKTITFSNWHYLQKLSSCI